MNKGFSLVEMAISIVIIGLLVAGATSGTALLQQAKLRGLINDVTTIKTAVLNFREVYDNAIPGDFRGAYAVWGSIGSCTNNDVNTVATGCNGNGDGTLFAWWGEPLNFWMHLSAAGMYPGSFPGAATGRVGGALKVGFSVPVSKYTPAGIYAAGTGIQPGAFPFSLIVGMENPGDRLTVLTLTALETFSIDNKTDEGSPILGDVRGTIYGIKTVGGTFAQWCSSGSSYLIDTPGRICNPLWVGSFIGK